MNDETTLGLARIGAVHIALPAALITEVVRGPLELSAFPQASAHVLGAFILRGEPVPAVDLATLIKGAGIEAARPVAFALVIGHAQGRFAVQVDEVLGVVKAPAEQITRMESRTEDGFFTHVYTAAKSGRVAVVLDADAVLTAAGVRLAVLARSEAAGAAEEGNDLCALVLFRSGGALVGLGAEHVRQVEKHPATLDTFFAHPALAGYHAFKERNLPVFALGAALGLGEETARESGHLVIMEGGGAAAALAVGAMVAVERGDAEKLQTLPAGTLLHPECYAGSYVCASGEVALVLNAAGLLRALGVEGEDGASDADARRRESEENDRSPLIHFLAYGAGGCTLATALTELDAVMVVPEDFIRLHAPGQALVGLCSRMGRTVRLLDLGSLLAAESVELRAGAIVICVEAPSGPVGFLVDEVNRLQAGRPQNLPGRDRGGHGRVPAFSQMIRVRGEGFDRSACVVSLAALAESLRDAMAAA